MVAISGVGEHIVASATTNIVFEFCTAITMGAGAKCVRIGTCSRGMLTGVLDGSGMLDTNGLDVTFTASVRLFAGMESAGMW